MNAPAGWEKVNEPWSYGRMQIGNDVFAPPKAPAGAPAPGAPPSANPATGGVIPSYLMDKAAGNLQTSLNGELSPDVVAQIQNHAASFGVANGLSGSDFSGYHGLTQLGLTAKGEQDRATAQLLPYFQTPGQQDQLTLQNQATAQANADRIRAQNAAYQQQGAQSWAAMKGTSAPLMAPGGAGGPIGGGAVHPSVAAAAGAPNYGADISNFISKYLPGAGASGPLNFGSAPTESGNLGNFNTAPVNLGGEGGGVTSTNLPPSNDWTLGGNWYDDEG